MFEMGLDRNGNIEIFVLEVENTLIKELNVNSSRRQCDLRVVQGFG